jgi:hypothetical protein
MMFDFLKKITPPYEAKLSVGTIDAYIDTASPTWRYVEKWAMEQLESSRLENDFQRLTELKTAALRGKIKLLKHLISLPTGVVRDEE